MQLNKGTKKLLRVLKQKASEIDKYTGDLVKETLRNRLLNTELSSMIKREGIGLYNDEIDAIVDEDFENLGCEDQKLFGTLRYILWLIETIEAGKCFNDFVLLDALLTDLEFYENYQLDILGQLIKTNSLAYELLEIFLNGLKNTRNTDNEYDGFIKKIEGLGIYCLNVTKMIEKDKSAVLKALMNPDNMNGAEKMIEAYKVINAYISDDGKFIPSKDIDSLYNALLASGLKLTERQTMLIIKSVSDKYNQKVLDEKAAEVVKPQKRVESVDNDATLNLKERKLAIQELKQYLKRDMPIKFIDDFELEIITNLLNKIGYTDIQIQNIKKSIKENNGLILSERLESYFNSAKLKYLSFEEIDILNQAEAIINDECAVDNELFIKIKEIYSFVKEQLFNLYEIKADDYPEHNDDAELLILYIEELRETIISYSYSDYRRLLKTAQQN